MCSVSSQPWEGAVDRHNILPDTVSIDYKYSQAMTDIHLNQDGNRFHSLESYTPVSGRRFNSKSSDHGLMYIC
jgi:hypothetical protein